MFLVFLWGLSEFHPLIILSISTFFFWFKLSWIGVGWSVQVHFGGGFLKPSPLHENCWVQQTPCPTCAIEALKCLSSVSTHDYQGDLKASLAGGVCNTNNVFANLLYCIRLCHPNEIYLLTYLLTNAIHFLLGKLSQMTKMTNNFKCAILSQLKSTHKFCTFQICSHCTYIAQSISTAHVSK